MLEEDSISWRTGKALALISLLLVSTALVGQSFIVLPQADAAPKDKTAPSSAADNTKPTLAITSPANGATVITQTGSIMIQGIASDNIGGSGVKMVEVKVDGGSYATATPKSAGDWSSWTATIQVGSGNHRITPRATDNAGNQAWNSIYINVVVDATSPIVAITSPANGATVLPGTALLVQGSSTDNSGGTGVETVQVRLDGGTYINAIPISAGDWSSWTASFGSDILTLGSHSVNAKAIDRAGNNKETSISITASDPTVTDTVAPSISITQPAANSAVAATEGNILVTGVASDNVGGSGVTIVEIRVDSGSYIPATPKSSGDWSSWSVSLPITGGEHRLVPRATDNAGNQAWNSIYVTVSDSTSGGTGGGSGGSGSGGDGTLDNFGIKRLYATTSAGNEWYVNMDNPKSDTNFRNLPTMTKQSDGSWQVSASQVRMEAWSPSDEKWLNVEITGYAKMISGTNELIQWYSRGGHHTDSNQCLGSAYKARLYGTGEARWVKEITHPAYTGSKGSMQATDDPLKGRWVGFKAVIYNFVENGKTYVRMESYIDDDVTDSKGNLVVGNNWKLAAVYEDKGGWSTTNSDFNASCFPVNKDSTQQYRQRDEIINMSGGTSTQNIAAWRSDGLTWNWKYLSVREIVPPT